MLELIGILLAILGSIGGVLWIIEKYRGWIKNKSFWRVFNLGENEKIIVVIPTGGKCANRSLSSQADEISTPNIITTIEDSMAKAAILSALSERGIQSEIRLHGTITEQEKTEHLFLICGPIGNTTTRELLSRQDVSLHYRFRMDNATWTIRDANNQMVHPKTDSTARDFAIVAKISNPWSRPERRTNVYLAAGIEGLGTWGAAHLLSHDFVRIVRYLKSQCATDGYSKFTAVISSERRGNNPPLVEIMHLKAM